MLPVLSQVNQIDAPGLVAPDEIQRPVEAVTKRLSGNKLQNVADTQTGRGGGRTVVNPGDPRAIGEHVDLEAGPDVAEHFDREELVEQFPHAIDRDRVVAVLLVVNAGADDADLLAERVDQRAARVARIAGRVELDELVPARFEVGHRQGVDIAHDRRRADDSLGEDDAAPAGVAGGQNRLSGHQVLAAPDRDGRGCFGDLQFQDGDVLAGQSADDTEFEAVPSYDGDTGLSQHHVIVGKEETVGMDHRGGSAAQSALLGFREDRQDSAPDVPDEADGGSLSW